MTDFLDLRDLLIRLYADYVRSFLLFTDSRLKAFIEADLLARERLWPEPLIELSPTYLKGPTVADLVREGLLHGDCARIFTDLKPPDPSTIPLYKHQCEAVVRALRGEPLVLTSGTGSGKSLAYWVPIFDYIIKRNPERATTRAIIVYPTNALVNSQLESLRRYAEGFGAGFPIRFARYTGQDTFEQKEETRQSPPHILLTNYVMLELMLSRPGERAFVDKTFAELGFLVLDELHTYRGRQGADVAMLVRRLRERCGNPRLQCIGTSATMVTAGSVARRREAVAEVASRVFGVSVPPENVIEEEVQRDYRRPPSRDELRRCLDGFRGGPGSADGRPIAALLEHTFGVQAEGSVLRKGEPFTLSRAARALAEKSGQDEAGCLQALREFFRSEAAAGTRGALRLGIRVHQFVSQGGSVHATLEPLDRRLFTLEGQLHAPGDSERLYFPLLFCRECGQDYYAVQYEPGVGVVRPVLGRGGNALDEDEDILSDGSAEGYLLIDENGLWSGREEDLPDGWFERGRVKKEFRAHVPQALNLTPAGRVGTDDEGSSVPCWFMPKPLLFCPRCNVVYTRRESEFRKVSGLSSEGRSTATTLMALFLITEMRRGAINPAEAKLLSFTDNRQDASLQAGHFNDFVGVALLRSSLLQALERSERLDHTNVAARVEEELNLDQQLYAREPGRFGELATRNREALRGVIEYRLFEDLRRGWRIVQPNLEQCGLLQIEYRGLREVCRDPEAWVGHPVLEGAFPELRERVVRALLDHMRRNLAIDAACLDPEQQTQLLRRSCAALNEVWAFEENEHLARAQRYHYPEESVAERGGLSLSPRSMLGRYLRARKTWDLAEDVPSDSYLPLMAVLLDALRGGGLLVGGEDRGVRFVRLRSDALVWRRGTGDAPEADPVRSRRLPRGDGVLQEREVNAFFREFYERTARGLKGIHGREHTAQLEYEDRLQREQEFAQGRLPLLTCTPTMELGIDIGDLAAVHLRNAPPTPANYAQRSGRAGRSGQGALIVTYCGVGSGHDQYYFHRRDQLVAGVVAAPKLDLTNEGLLTAHIHSMWLARTGADLGHSVRDVLELLEPGLPIRAELHERLKLSPRVLDELVIEVEGVLTAANDALKETAWFNRDWIKVVVHGALPDFDRAFDRWREIYRAADRQWTTAMEHLRVPPRDRDAREDSERSRNEAERQKTILCSESSRREDSDFYPYRYLASEGFLPGYNFPRLPVRAYLPRGQGKYLARQRFLAISEYGPLNLVYHDGVKYQVRRSFLAPGPDGPGLVRGKACKECGTVYLGQAADMDLCGHCGCGLTGEGVEFMPSLLEMPTTGTVRRERITCDEEERRRRGFLLGTYLAGGTEGRDERRVSADVRDAAEAPSIVELRYAQAATLVRVNHGWRQSRDSGFSLDLDRGNWIGQEEASETGPGAGRIVRGVRLFVRETRNALVIVPGGDEEPDGTTLASLQHALQRGIEAVYQIEHNELDGTRLGRERHRRILLWEGAEGGVGVLRSLVEDPGALARVARAALEACHFDPETGEDRAGDDCPRACYACLLSYTNQPDHLILDRHVALPWLLRFAKSTAYLRVGPRTYDEHHRWLMAQTDARSDLEREFLDHLYRTGRRLPDYAQRALADYMVRPDFYYDQSRACVFCDGPVHDRPDQRAEDERVRREIAARGYRVTTIRYDRDIEEQLQLASDVFGEPGTTVSRSG